MGGGRARRLNLRPLLRTGHLGRQTCHSSSMRGRFNGRASENITTTESQHQHHLGLPVRTAEQERSRQRRPHARGQRRRELDQRRFQDDSHPNTVRGERRAPTRETEHSRSLGKTRWGARPGRGTGDRIQDPTGFQTRLNRNLHYIEKRAPIRSR